MSDNALYSTKLSDELYRKYFEKEKTTRARNILIMGGWGTGKTTVKNKLIDKVKQSYPTIKVVDFNAMQFEEDSQVTSQFYYTISKAFLTIPLFPFGLKNKFKAVSYLKKESNQVGVSIDIILQVVLIGLIAFICSRVSKLELVNDWLSSFSYGKQITDPVLGNKLILLGLIIMVIYFLRNRLVQWISSYLPSKSHVDILQSIKFGKSDELLIMVDELDRLGEESAKYLLDEILILKDSLNSDKNNENRCTIFVFCDVDSIKIKNNHNTTAMYLKKHFDHYHWIFIASQKNKIKSLIESNYLLEERNETQNHFDEFFSWINNNFDSFRDVDNILKSLIEHVSNYRINQIMYDYSSNKIELATITYCLKKDSSNSNEIRSVFIIMSIAVFVYHEISQIRSKKHNCYGNLDMAVQTIINNLIIDSIYRSFFQNIVKYEAEIIQEQNKLGQKISDCENILTIFRRIRDLKSGRTNLSLKDIISVQDFASLSEDIDNIKLKIYKNIAMQYLYESIPYSDTETKQLTNDVLNKKKLVSFLVTLPKMNKAVGEYNNYLIYCNNSSCIEKANSFPNVSDFDEEFQDVAGLLIQDLLTAKDYLNVELFNNERHRLEDELMEDLYEYIKNKTLCM